MNIVDVIAPAIRAGAALFMRDATYTLPTGQTATLLCYWRGMRPDEIFAGAMQQDVNVVLDASAFFTAFPARISPARLDRITVGPRTWSVESWRGAPNDIAPVFFRLVLRGGSQ
jgi:hypothetical protein